MSSTDASELSSAIYASLYFLCQAGPLPVSFTWSQAEEKRPSRGIVMYDKDQSCLLMSEFKVPTAASKTSGDTGNGAGLNINRYRMSPTREVPTRGPPVSVTIPAFYNELILVHLLPSLVRKKFFTPQEIDLCLDKKRTQRVRAVLKNFMATVIDVFSEAREDPMILDDLWEKQNFVEFNQLEIIRPREHDATHAFLEECFPSASDEELESEEESTGGDTQLLQRLSTLEEQMTVMTTLMDKQRADTKEILSLLRNQVAHNRAPSRQCNRTSSRQSNRTSSQRPNFRPGHVTSFHVTNCRTWETLKEVYPCRGDLFRFILRCVGVSDAKLKDTQTQLYYKEFKSAFYKNIEADLSDPENADPVAQIHKALGHLTSHAH